MNAIQLTGRLVRDPDLRTTSSGEYVCGMRIAVEGMGRSNTVGYVDVSVWGKPGQACARVLSRGWLVGVAGRLEYREWSADDGTKRSAHAVVGAVDFLAAPRAQASSEQAAAA